MEIINKIKKRIKTLEIIKEEAITEVQITRQEAEQLPDKIKSICGAKLIIVDNLGDISKKDCFAYQDNKCYALNDLYCKRENCRFYRNDIKISKIESDIRRYPVK